jgi:heterokaryon incompatibility protein (HET)
MLHRFRKKEKTLNLWIDAVCLEQSNKQEVAQQVALMDEIYNQSTKGRVWIGVEDQDVAKVLAFFRTLANIETLLSNEDEGPSVKSIENPNTKDIEKRVSEIFSTEITGKVEQFFHRPWFTRRWVLQELALGRDATVYCYGRQISWRWLSKAVQNLIQILKRYGNLDAFYFSKSTRTRIENIQSLSEAPRSLLDNLYKYHQLECSDPRDRLFAPLGFSVETFFQVPDKPALANTIMVDYIGSTEDIFRCFAAEYVRRGKINTILHHSLAFGSLSLRYRNAPSWCPDWSQRGRKFTNILDPADIIRKLGPAAYKWKRQYIDSPGSPLDRISINSKTFKNGRRVVTQQLAVIVYNTTAASSGPITWTGIADATYRLLPEELILSAKHDKPQKSQHTRQSIA